MTRYSIAGQHRPAPRKPQTPALWRGIGCFLILIIPIMSWLLAIATVEYGERMGWPFPYQLMGYPVAPELLWYVPALGFLLAIFQSQRNLYAIMAITVIYVIVASAIISFGYAVVYRFVGPPRYGPVDAPPPGIKVKRYKR